MNRKTSITESLFNVLYGADAEDNPFETKEIHTLFVSLSSDENYDALSALLFHTNKNAFFVGYRTAFQLILDAIIRV